MSGLLYRLGFALRETGQALERTGARLQGINSFEEEITRLRPLLNFEATAPSVASTAFVAPTAAVVGEVEVGHNASIWYNAVVRGDVHPVTIGQGTNLQDGVYAGSLSPSAGATKIGSFVSVGHGAALTACTVGDHCLIGMGAVLQPGSKVEGRSILAAGAVLSSDSVVPKGEVWGGNPAKKLRALNPKEQEYLSRLPQRYTRLAAEHQEVLDALFKHIDLVTEDTAE